MLELWFKSVPFSKEHVTLALESGVDGLIVPVEHVQSVASLARCTVLSDLEMPPIALNNKEDEQEFVNDVQSGKNRVLAAGWEIIPVENILAQCPVVAAEARNFQEARLAAGILERGVSKIILLPEAIMELKEIISELKTAQGKIQLEEATITKVCAVGLGHRVCVDTLSVFHKGQGMLVGNSSAFTFLVHAETEHNEYVAARPFRINAGAVHAYAQLPQDKTCYLGELRSGEQVLILNAEGNATLASVGRVKIEVRPMLLIEAKTANGTSGTIFLQNAETIRLTRPDGEPISVVLLQEGDKILCHTDSAGRHFGMRITEEIQEV